ncbi:hypothetical protein [Marichromatium gracile]|uniref:Major capsid protein E n=1 Tax=Marichromatium gracile TaxID=1048 RepID=A0A4R4A4J3_MARGR|nr:hypothetical protein [Marichromatium gracile]MBK1709806.1 hypothetical protein [Marichromatium gracile]TCW32684.1 hypothetical protein EDC29_11750 [Marichromatium gracile]
MPLNTQNARIVDPVLTNHVRGYKNPDVQRIGSVLFPRAPIAKRGAKIVRFGKESFRRHATERAPGDRIRRVRVGYTSDSVNLFQHALAGEVPRELLQEAEGVPSVNLQMRAMALPAEVIEREKEIKAATIASNPASYAASNHSALTGVSRWNGSSAAISADADAAQDMIRSKTGRRANVLAVGPAVARRLRRSEAIISNFFTGNTRPDRVTDAQIAEFFGVARFVEGTDTVVEGKDADGGDFKDIWGNVAILAYVPTVTGDGDIEVPSYGYEYYLQGHPMVEPGRWDADTKTWVYDVIDEYQHVLTAMDAGFLFSNVMDLKTP